MSQAQILKELLQQISSDGKRSTALQPLIWLVSIVLFGTLSSFYFNLPEWVSKIFLFSLLGIIFIFIGAYIYFMLTNSDALRSETYSLNKMAIEKSMVGDSISGLITIEEDKAGNVIEMKSEDKAGEEQ